MTCARAVLFLFVLAPSRTVSGKMNCPAGCECSKTDATCVGQHFTALPELDENMTSLILSGNELKILHEDAFKNVKGINLVSIQIVDSELQVLHSNAFNDLSELKRLDLSSNNLSYFPPETLKPVWQLLKLELKKNPLGKLVPNQFQSDTLREIDVSFCKLESVHKTAFAHLPELEKVIMSGNLLTYLHKDTFQINRRLTITLTDNNWNCDCQLKEFHKWGVDKYFSGKEICSTPDHMKDRLWTRFSSSLPSDNHFTCPPTVETDPKAMNASVGEVVVFGCLIEGDPKPAPKWELKSKLMHNNTADIQIYSFPYNSTEEEKDDVLKTTAYWYNVTISKVTTNLAGEWKCSASNIAGFANSTATLTVEVEDTTTSYLLFYIIGICLLALLLLVSVIGCIMCLVKRRKRAKRAIPKASDEGGRARHVLCHRCLRVNDEVVNVVIGKRDRHVIGGCFKMTCTIPNWNKK